MYDPEPRSQQEVHPGINPVLEDALDNITIERGDGSEAVSAVNIW